jgi:hypothetical protein
LAALIRIARTLLIGCALLLAPACENATNEAETGDRKAATANQRGTSAPSENAPADDSAPAGVPLQVVAQTPPAGFDSQPRAAVPQTAPAPDSAAAPPPPLEIADENLVAGVKDGRLLLIINVFPNKVALDALPPERAVAALTATALRETAAQMFTEEYKDLPGARVELIDLASMNEYGEANWSSMVKHGAVVLQRKGDLLTIVENHIARGDAKGTIGLSVRVVKPPSPPQSGAEKSTESRRPGSVGDKTSTTLHTAPRTDFLKPRMGLEVIFDELDLYDHPACVMEFYSDFTPERVRPENALYFLRCRAAADRQGPLGRFYGEILSQGDACSVLYLPRNLDRAGLEGVVFSYRRTDPNATVYLKLYLSANEVFELAEGESPYFTHDEKDEWHEVAIPLSEFRRGEGLKFPEKSDPRKRSDGLRYYSVPADKIFGIEIAVRNTGKNASLFFDRICFVRSAQSGGKLKGTVSPAATDVSVHFIKPYGTRITAAPNPDGTFEITVPAGVARYEALLKKGDKWHLAEEGRYFEAGTYLTPLHFRTDKGHLAKVPDGFHNVTYARNTEDLSINFQPGRPDLWIGERTDKAIEYCAERFVNNIGYMDRDHRLENPDKVFRVVIMGSCLVESRQIDTQDWASNQIESIFRFRGDAIPVEVASIARTQLFFTSFWAPMLNCALKMKPEMIILNVDSPVQTEYAIREQAALINGYDPDHSPVPHFDLTTTDQLKSVPHDVQSELYRANAKKAENRNPYDWTNRQLVTMAELESGKSLDDPSLDPQIIKAIRIYKKTLELYVAEAKKASAQLCIAYTSPWGNKTEGIMTHAGVKVDSEVFLRTMKRMAEGAGALFVNVYDNADSDLKLDWTTNSALFKVDEHWSPQGQRFIAETLAKFIRQSPQYAAKLGASAQPPTAVAPADSAKKTYVLMTIDSEVTPGYENAFWSYQVNGHMPDDIDPLIQGGVAVKSPNGYKLTPDWASKIRAVRDFRDFRARAITDLVRTPTSATPVETRLAQAQAGLPLFFRLFQKWEMPAVVFLDISGLYNFGPADFLETTDLIKQCGHETQLHLHPSFLPQEKSAFRINDFEWFRSRGITVPQPYEIQNWPKEIVQPVLKACADDLAYFSGMRPFAYRGGSYQASDIMMNTLAELGFKFDSSFNQYRLDTLMTLICAQNKVDNAPLAYKNIIELPITIYEKPLYQALMRFRADDPAGSDAEALGTLHRSGVPVVTFILHSYELMKQVVASESERNAGNLGYYQGPNESNIADFERKLAYIKNHPGLQVVTLRQLHDLAKADPSILMGSGAIPRVPASQIPEETERKGKAFASMLGGTPPPLPERVARFREKIKARSKEREAKLKANAAQTPVAAQAAQARKSYILFTIDTETSLLHENSFFSYFVNGHFPDDLDAIVKAGIAKKSPHGYFLEQDIGTKLKQVRDFEDERTETPSSKIPVSERLQKAEAGLPLIFREFDKYGFPCVVLLDISGLYNFGPAEFREAIDLTQQTGNELQLHYHVIWPFTGETNKRWFQDCGIPLPINGEPQLWPQEAVEACLRRFTDDIQRLSGGERPFAFRGGSYKISDPMVDALANLGYRFDTSYNLHRPNSVTTRICSQNHVTNAAFPYRRMVEIPITVYEKPMYQASMRIDPREPNGAHTDALDALHEQGARVIMVILHSYELMTKGDATPQEEAEFGSRGYFLGPDQEAIHGLDAILEYIYNHPGLEVVDFRTLWERIKEDPDILMGSGDIPRAPVSQIPAETERKFTVFRNILAKPLPADPSIAAATPAVKSAAP